MEKHKVIAIGIFLIVSILSFSRDESRDATKNIIVLAAFLAPILFYRIIAFFSGFGFPEFFAKDFKSENHPGPYAFFFWILFLIACAFVLFQ
ncbi:MAG: hypothetical protein ABW170_13165 [Candidatus Thiodiazotropha sp. L084R]